MMMMTISFCKRLFNVLLGAYPCLEFSLVLKRDPGSYITTIVFPSVVIVAMSWSSFFVPVNLQTAKLTIALITALSSLAMHVLCRTVLAPVLKNVSYITLMDVWMVYCLLFVLCAMVLQLIVVSRASNQQQLQVQTVETLNFKIYISVVHNFCGRSITYSSLFTITVEICRQQSNQLN